MPMIESEYKKDVVTRLQADPRSVRQISEESGLGFEWLKKLHRNGIPDPGIVRLEALRTFLIKTRKRARA